MPLPTRAVSDRSCLLNLKRLPDMTCWHHFTVFSALWWWRISSAAFCHSLAAIGKIWCCHSEVASLPCFGLWSCAKEEVARSKCSSTCCRGDWGFQRKFVGDLVLAALKICSKAVGCPFHEAALEVQVYSGKAPICTIAWQHGFEQTVFVCPTTTWSFAFPVFKHPRCLLRLEV